MADAYRDGLIEIQDGGSQLACEAVARAARRDGDRPLRRGRRQDARAGGGDGQGQGTLVAADTDRGRLSRLAPRAARAGALVAETVLLNPGRELEALAAWHGKADAVLVDAPCSGSGTWRRNPEARWRLDAAELERLVATPGTTARNRRARWSARAAGWST